MKLCTKCNVEKPFEEFYPDKRRNSYRSMCKGCERISSLAYNTKNREKVNARTREYYQKNRLKSMECVKRCHAKKPEKIKEYARIRTQRCIENLPDYYVANQIARPLGIKPKDVPKELIELQRTLMLNNRLIKRGRNE